MSDERKLEWQLSNRTAERDALQECLDKAKADVARLTEHCDAYKEALEKLSASARRHINSFHPSSLEGSELNLKNTLDEIAALQDKTT